MAFITRLSDITYVKEGEKYLIHMSRNPLLGQDRINSDKIKHY